MRLTTALEERKELRKSVHFNQINVRSWDKMFELCFELCTLSFDPAWNVV